MPNNFCVGGKGVKYSGPTYSGIRSGKHDTLDAWSHGLDTLKTFQSFEDFLFEGGKLKPSLLWESDGAAAQQVKSDKMKKTWLYIFKH